MAALLQPAASASGSATSPLAGALPALDTTSFGDDGSASDAGGPSSLSALPSAAQLLTGSALGSGAAVSALASTSATASTAGAGQRALAAAQAAIGISESPSGSNDGPGLAIFRSAVQGAQAGEPWCAYFASWASREGGVPLGDGGTGLASVQGITEWAGRTGRLLPAGATPQPGDLVLFGTRHVGLVESVNGDGTLTTVEGNYRNSVQRVRRSPLEASGYVRLG